MVYSKNNNNNKKKLRNTGRSTSYLFATVCFILTLKHCFAQISQSKMANLFFQSLVQRIDIVLVETEKGSPIKFTVLRA